VYVGVIIIHLYIFGKFSNSLIVMFFRSLSHFAKTGVRFSSKHLLTRFIIEDEQIIDRGIKNFRNVVGQ